MDKKNKIIIFPVIFVASIAILLVITVDIDENNAQNIPESTKNYVYIPSDITKINPNFVVENNESSWRTTSVSDVAYDVDLTITGTVLEIGDSIDRISSEDAISGIGLIPITMTVDNVYKGQLDTQTFTFYLTSIFFFFDENDLEPRFMPDTEDEIHQILNDKNKKYYLFSDSGQFEIGEKILVHIDQSVIKEPYMIDNLENLELINPYYHLILGEYSKYQIQGDVAYNESFPIGLSLDFVANESQ